MNTVTCLSGALSFKDGPDLYLLLNSCLILHACQVNEGNLRKTPINKTTNAAARCVFAPREQSGVRRFTFDTLEQQLGPLQTPGYGHLLHAGQKAERDAVGILENTRSHTKYKHPPKCDRVCGQAERAIDPGSQVEGARVESWVEAHRCKGLLLLKQLTTNLLVSSTRNRCFRVVCDPGSEFTGFTELQV